MRAAIGFSALALTWAACSAPLKIAQSLLGEPTLTPAPTFAATPTASATARPTRPASPTPTLDLGPTPSPFPTFAIPTASSTATPASALDCRLDWQSPGNGIEIAREERFTVGWKVTNSGSETWSPGIVEFTYVSGARLHNDPVEQLESSVSPGGSVILSAEMRAPRNSTLYTTYWSLRQGATYFCRVSVSIYAK